MKIAFLFAGQGAQRVGMGSDFYSKYASYREAVDSVSGYDYYKSLMEEGPDEVLKMTENTQPCMALYSIGVKAVLDELCIKADAVCGLSIGEYGALYAANMISAEEYVNIVKYRGQVMAEASKGINCAMSAIVGIDAEYVQKAVEECQEFGYVTVANYNCPGQYVICGEESAIERCEASCKESGAKRAIRLNVSGPFHTKYMKSAGSKLRKKLDEIDFGKPTTQLLINTTGDYYEGQNMPQVLELQIQNSVHFEDEIIKLFENDFDTFIEIGPGKAISGFIKKTAKKVEKEYRCISIDCVEDIEDIKKLIG